MTNFQNGPTILQILTRNEILFLGAAYHIVNETPDEFWKKIRESLSSNFSSDECNEVAAALTRTGLILPVSAWGGMAYIASPAPKELGRLAEIEPTSVDL
jgi:hypothetical protein